MKKHQIIIIFIMIVIAPSHSQMIPHEISSIKNEGFENRKVRLKKIINDLAVSTTDDEIKLTAVNNFFNREILFSTDIFVWGEVDYWATPSELLMRGSGDCEDYAIAKYFSLINAGIYPEKLRLVYARAQLGDISQAHMVVAYFKTPAAQPLILDNLITEIRSLERRSDLKVVYSFNQVDIWKELGSENLGSAMKRLSKWREVVEKIKLEEKTDKTKRFDTLE